MHDTSTTDEFTALRYLREYGTSGAAIAALRESITWRETVMEPLLRSPARVVDELMTERVWLLPQPNRHGNPVIVFNSAKAALQPTREQQAEMVLATLFVIEKAVSCSDNPLVSLSTQIQIQLPPSHAGCTRAYSLLTPLACLHSTFVSALATYRGTGRG